MVCAGCGRQLEPGDRYIQDTASGYAGCESNAEIDSIIADIMGGNRTLDGSTEGRVVFCEACTVRSPDGRYVFQTCDQED